MARVREPDTVRTPDTLDESFWRVYNRPVFVKEGMSGVPTAFMGSLGENRSDAIFEQRAESFLVDYNLGKYDSTIPL